MSLADDINVRHLLEDSEFVDDIIGSLVSDPAAFRKLTEDAAEELEDLLEDAPAFRSKIVEAASSNVAFKREIIAHLVREMKD